jgi:signal transduction histidine kinase
MRSTSRHAVWLSALAIGAFQVMGTFGAAHNQPERRAIDAWAIVLVLLGPAALAFRDRRPVLAAAVAVAAADVYIGFGYPYGPIFLSVVVALFVAIEAGHRRATWSIAAAGYVGFVFAYLVDRDGGATNWGHLALVAGWLVVVLAVSELVRSRRQQAAEVDRARRADRLRRVGEQRLLLAQELHDVLAHNISLINVQASVALHLLDDEPDRARPALTNIKAASSEALHELRTALDVLRSGDEAPRAPAPGLADLDDLIAGVRASGLDVRVEDDGPPGPLTADVELAAYRIVQEALTNVTRHAGAGAVTVRLSYDDGVSVEVTDDGVGGGGEPGNGIVGMQERAMALGGEVAAGPCPGGGFRVSAHLPTRSP